MNHDTFQNEYLHTIDDMLKRYAGDSHFDDLRQELIVMILEIMNDPEIASCLDDRLWLRKKIERKIDRFLHDARKHGGLDDIDRIDESEHPLSNETHAGDLSDLDIIYLRVDQEAFAGTLPARLQKIVILLRKYSKPEIAKKLNISETTLHRDFQKIRELAAGRF